MSRSNFQNSMPTTTNAREWLLANWKAGNAVNTFQKISSETERVLADTRFEIAQTLASDDEKMDFFKFCSRCGFTDLPSWERERKKQINAA